MQSLFFAFFALNILRCIWGRKLDMAFHASQKLLVVGCWLHRSSNILVGVPLRDLMDQTPHLTGFCPNPHAWGVPAGCAAVRRGVAPHHRRRPGGGLGEG